MVKNSDVEKHLPKRAPKKTGKRGIKPLDQISDFETPVTKQTPMSAGPLAADNPPKPKIVGDRMEVFYLKPIFGKTDKGDITVALAMTMPLEKEHSALLPKIVADGYHDVMKKGRKGMTFNGVPGQRAEFYLSSDIKEEALVLPAAKMTNVSIAIVERKGEGSARRVIRLSFRLQVKLSHEVAHFAENNLENSFWLTLEETQEELFDEEGED
jgi:hypothetical protein